MKYHYRQGVTEKDEKSHPKLWITFFVIFALITYAGFCFTTLILNGWPLSKIDETAKVIKQSKPGSMGDRLFIPAINLSVSSRALNISNKSDDPGNKNIVIKGSEFGFGATPGTLREASPFFNLSKLKEGDEIFLDKSGTRYAYKVVTIVSDEDKETETDVALTLQNGRITKQAQAIGTVAWKNGSSELEEL